MMVLTIFHHLRESCHALITTGVLTPKGTRVISLRVSRLELFPNGQVPRRHPSSGSTVAKEYFEDSVVIVTLPGIVSIPNGAYN